MVQKKSHHGSLTAHRHESASLNEDLEVEGSSLMGYKSYPEELAEIINLMCELKPIRRTGLRVDVIDRRNKDFGQPLR
jgi:hypothetical protein